MELERHQVINDRVKRVHKAKGQAAAILVAILVSSLRTNPIFKLGREIHKSNAYLKFGRSQVTNDLYMCPRVQINRRWPSWLVFIRKTQTRILV